MTLHEAIDNYAQAYAVEFAMGSDVTEEVKRRTADSRAALDSCIAVHVNDAYYEGYNSEFSDRI